MRSHLTRNVFRRLLANDGYLFTNCPRRSPLFIHQRHGASPFLQLSPRRSLFGFSKKGPKQKKDKEIDLDPGLGQMFYLMQMDVMKTRPPPPNELVKAFNSFMGYKQHMNEAVNDLHAAHVLHTFRHLRDLDSLEPRGRLTDQDLEIARGVMLLPLAENTNPEVYLEFLVEVNTELQNRRDAKEGNEEATLHDLRLFVTGLCRFGRSSSAKKVVEDFWKDNRTKSRKLGIKFWNLVLDGLSREKKEAELVKAAQTALEAGVPYRPSFQRIMVTFFARKDDVEATKFWYNKSFTDDKDGNFKPDANTMRELLQFCVRNDELDWCNEVFPTLLETNPDKPTWDVVFQWAAGGLGKGVEEVEHMMQVMVRHNEDNPLVRPDSDTINGLVELSILKNDYYLAERYLSLASKLHIRPNAKTLILQMEYRVEALDFSGAQASYEALQGQEIEDKADLPVINKYLRALCTSKSPNYDTIISLVEDLEDREARLEGDTVSALCLYHLYRNEFRDANNVIKMHSFHNSIEERARTRLAVLEFCFDRKMGSWPVWEWYNILREMFGEIDIETRIRLMHEFFERGRSDMATHVFGHMRQQQYDQGRPTLEAYVQCLEGIANAKDKESLTMVHNMLTMDSYIEPNTKLYNALMLAYMQCGGRSRALKFWTTIKDSVEGPTYSSLRIIFQNCKESVDGLDTAKDIWEQMRQMEIDVPPDVFRGYIGVLARHDCVDEAKALIENMETITGHPPDVSTTVQPMQQYEVQRWIKQVYPKLWEGLQEHRIENSRGVTLFAVPTDGELKP